MIIFQLLKLVNKLSNFLKLKGSSDLKLINLLDLG